MRREELDLGNLVAIHQNKIIVLYRYWEENDDDIDIELELYSDHKLFNKVELLFKNT